MKKVRMTLCFSLAIALVGCGGGKDKKETQEKVSEGVAEKPSKKEVDEPETMEEPKQSEDKSKKAVVTAKSGLSLRLKEDATSKLVVLIPTNGIVKVLEKGANATFNGKKSNWYKVQYGTKEGYAFGGFLKMGSSLSATSSASASTAGEGEVTDNASVLQKGLITAKSGLTLRKKPSAKAESITVIPTNAEVGVLEFAEESLEINGMQGVWCKVRYAKKEGYLFSAYINLSTATISAKSGLTLRAEPSKMGKQITVIPTRKEVYLLPATNPDDEMPDNVIYDEDGNVWYKVRYGKFEGYAFAEFLEIEAGC